MKKFKIITLLFVGIILWTGCDLSEELISDLSGEEHYSTPEGIEDLSLVMYEPLWKYYGRESGTIITAPGTDIFEYGGGTRRFMNDYTFTPNPSGRGFVHIWNHFYRGINLANSLISRVDDADITDAQRTRWVAEARFLRAHYYHILVQQFGPVHLTLEETEGVETEANRAPEDEIWAAVIEDLEFAMANLPEIQTEFGRATSGAAKHNLARVHLIIENWQEAADLATEIINSGTYNLLDSYAEVFDPYIERTGGYPGPKHEETIWGIEKTNTTWQRQFGDASDWIFTDAKEYMIRLDAMPGVALPYPKYGNKPSARYRATPFFLEEVFGNDPNMDLNIWNDSRYFSSFIEVWYYDDQSSLPSGFAVGDTAFYNPSAAHYQELTDEEVAAKPYTFMRIKDRTSTWFAGPVHKLRHREEEFGRTLQIFRLAETYLIAAEALMMLGNLDEAADYFNTVRKRAEVPGETIPLITSGGLNIDEILDERARELHAEYLRWYDLKRTGTLLERVRAHNAAAAPNIQEYHYLRPIPQNQIDRTSNEYEQNPGY